MITVNTNVLQAVAQFAGYQLQQCLKPERIVWELRQQKVAYLFDSPWDVLEGMDWLRQEPEAAKKLLRKRKLGTVVVQDNHRQSSLKEISFKESA